MGKIGCGYGSEWHLLRFMGRHRGLLNRRILEVVGGDGIDWLEFGFHESKPWLDAEIRGLGFLQPDDPVRMAWNQWWPQGRGIHNWDAVGRVRSGDAEEWLLVEAKAHLGELISDCAATSQASRLMIQHAFAQTKQALGVPEGRDWMHDYYQFCNRVAALYFLNEHGVPARLLHVYFIGDQSDARRACPAEEKTWREAIQAQETHIGLPASHRLKDRMRELFLPVAP